MSRAIAGINVGGTTTSVVLGDEDGAIVARRAWPTQAQDGEALCTAIVAAVRDVAPQAEIAGVAIGGPMDARRGLVIGPPHLPGMHGVPLRARLEDALGIPAAVHHDAAACALAESRWGSDPDAALAYLTCGTGFGAGLVIAGRARYGATGLSPEIGHIRYRDDGPDLFGKPGCFESWCAGNALPLLARRHDPSFDARDGAEVAQRAAAGDAAAHAAIGDNADAVGAACALLADLLVLDVVVLGSLATYFGEPWLARVRARFESEALSSHVRGCRLRPVSVPDLQDRSALAAALDPVQ